MSKKRKAKRPRRAAPTGKAPVSAPKPAARVAPSDDRPPAPWGKFSLAALTILAGIVSLAIGVIGGHPTAIGLGVALAALGGLEVAIREHFAGYRSHTTLLAAVGGLATLLALYYVVDLPPAVAAAVGAGVGLACAYFLVRLFRAKSGGHSVKIR